MGYAVPTFAHLSMILGADGKKLSKRHGATSVEEYRDQGYLPDTLVSFLALLGGIGFTMAIFVANLAFVDPVAVTIAKVGILSASLVAGVAGWMSTPVTERVAEEIIRAGRWTPRIHRAWETRCAHRA